MTGDCRDCRDYRGCFGKPWFNYSEIRFCLWQVLWIIQSADTLRAGHWPPDPDKADDNSGQRTVKADASFTKPVLILAEVETRLRRTGIYGKLLIAQVEAGKEFTTLDYEARLALLYVKGWRRKAMSFRTWKIQREYRENDYQKLFKNQNRESQTVA